MAFCVKPGSLGLREVHETDCTEAFEDTLGCVWKDQDFGMIKVSQYKATINELANGADVGNRT